MAVPVQAQPPIPPGEKGIYFLVPKDSAVPEKYVSTTIDVWVNSSLNVTQINTDYVF